MEPVAALVDNEVQPFDFPPPQKPLSPPIIAMEGVSAGYGERTVLSRLDLSRRQRRPHRPARLERQRQVDLRQASGGRLEAMGGRLRRSSGMKVAYFAQHQLDELNRAGHAREAMSPR